MTQAVDPFAQADGTAPTPPVTAPAGDPFNQPGGGGDYLKPANLRGALLLISPVKIEQVPAYRDNSGKMVDRLSADTVVLTGEHAGTEFDAMYWSQKPIIKAAAKAMRDNVPSILGTLQRVPIGEDKKSGKYSTPEGIDYAAFEAAMEAWRKGDPEIEYAWVLVNFTEDDAQIARDYLAKKNAR